MSTDELQTVITNYIAALGPLPAQKSAEWYDLRHTSIGGSEVATVLGLNPFSKLCKLIADKSGTTQSTFCGNLATRWGTLFESITREWTQSVLEMNKEIQEIGSVEGVIKGQRYSPDGIGVVQLLDENDEPNNYITLFEFKAPFKSLPDGRIPKHYVPQIQTGMLTIPICELGIFVNNCYRKCALADIGFSMVYDTNFYKSDFTKKRTQKQRFESISACGIIFFYQTIQQYNDAQALYHREVIDITMLTQEMLESFDGSSGISEPPYDKTILVDSAEEPIDFGTAKERMTERLFELYAENRITPVYYPIIINQAVVNDYEFIQTHNKSKPVVELNPKKIIEGYIENFITRCIDNEHVIVGYLPWKLIKSDIILETKDENWKTRIEQPITEALKIISEIRNSDDPKKKYNEYYPDTYMCDQDEYLMTDIIN